MFDMHMAINTRAPLLLVGALAPTLMGHLSGYGDACALPGRPAGKPSYSSPQVRIAGG